MEENVRIIIVGRHGNLHPVSHDLTAFQNSFFLEAMVAE